MFYKDEIYENLFNLNTKLSEVNIMLYLKVVGGAALIFNNIEAISTEDIDTIIRLENEVKEVIEECGIDINDDALDYIQNYDGLEFIHDSDHEFSNIDIQYLSLGGVVKTKMISTDTDKLEDLRYLLEEVLEISMDIESIIEYIRNLGVVLDKELVQRFLEETDL